MSEKFTAKIRVYSVPEEQYLLYKYRGMFYPIPITEECDENETSEHKLPCPYRAAMVAQNQYAPIFDKKDLKRLKKNMKLETIFSF